MNPTLATLKAELDNDTAGIGYTGSDEEVLAKLNAKNRPKINILTSAELLAWSGANERALKIDEASKTHASRAIQAVAIAASRLLARDNTILDLSLSDRVAMVDALIAGGVLTPADKQSLFDLATKNISRLEELGIGEVHLGDIGFCRRGLK